MTSKVIYFKVGDRDEQAEISSDIPTEDVKDLFRCAAEAGPNDILKLYNIKGNIVNISGKLQENSPETRYRLEAVATNCPACGVCGKRILESLIIGEFDIRNMELTVTIQALLLISMDSLFSVQCAIGNSRIFDLIDVEE